MAKKIQVGFIGGGNMAEALIRGLLQGKTLSASQCRVHDVLQDRLAYLKKTYGVQTASTPGPAVEPSQVVILAVKPQQIHSRRDNPGPTGQTLPLPTPPRPSHAQYPGPDQGRY
jgi:pyrroline-5-carboxylate reductase